MADKNEEIKGTKEEFIKEFEIFCYKNGRNRWEAWQDLMSFIAFSISNACDNDIARKNKRESEYMSLISRYKYQDYIPKLFAMVVIALEKNPDQDFLGELYMSLDLGSHWHGQFFTPYSVCRMMAEMLYEDKRTRNIITVNDSSCGAGATLIAQANLLKQKGINYQKDAIFVGQDIDRVVAMMCYIQLSLLGCSGYIVVANTLTNPVCGSVLLPEEKEGQEFWYTPMFQMNSGRMPTHSDIPLPIAM